PYATLGFHLPPLRPLRSSRLGGCIIYSAVHAASGTHAGRLCCLGRFSDRPVRLTRLSGLGTKHSPGEVVHCFARLYLAQSIGEGGRTRTRLKSSHVKIVHAVC